MSKLRDFIARKRIPKDTPYCHDYNMKDCPYWKSLRLKDCNGRRLCYCKYLKVAEVYQGESLLWDQCKECGINEEE